MEELLELAARCRDRLDARIPGIIEAFPGRIHCRPGCSGRCSLAVETTLPEAIAIARGLAVDQAARLARQAEALRAIRDRADDLKTFLRLKRIEVGACPLLGQDGCCQIYRLRPLACRALLSTRDSAWCAVDFADLPAIDRDLYLKSLDPGLVAWPTHYLAASQDAARDLEEELLSATRTRFGFSLSGQLAALVWLAGEHDLATTVREGREAVAALLDRTGLGHPFLVRIEP